MKYKFITYVFYSQERNEIFFVNFGECSVLKSSGLTSTFYGSDHWMLKDSVLIDSFIEKTRAK